MATGHSYNDPVYDKIEARVEKKYGLTPGLMRRIRTRGERSNSDQVSEDNARTVYQIIPSTRAGVLKNYGVDAYKDINSAAEAAALVLREGKQRNHGDEAAAVLEYHGGIDRSQWGERTRAYGRRVNGVGSGYTPSDGPDEPIKDFTGAWLHSRPGDPLIARPPHEHIADESREHKRQRLLKAQIGDTDLYSNHAPDTRDVGATEIREGERAAAMQSVEDAKLTPWQRLSASWHDNTLTASILRHMDDQHFKPEEGFTDWYLQNRDEIEKGRDDDEVAQLREAVSQGSLQQIQHDIELTRERRAMYTGRGASGTDAVLYSLMGGIADPVGLLAGEGVGTAFKFAGVGAKTLYAARRPLAGALSQVGEYALGNVAVTGGMDMAGDYTTSKDYAMAAAFGATLGAAAAPFSYRFTGKSVPEHFSEQALNARREQGELLDAAERAAGPDAAPEDVLGHAQRIDAQSHGDTVTIALADQPDELKLMSDKVLTSDAELKARVEHEHGLDGLHDEGERPAITEMVARAEKIDEQLDIKDERLDPATRLGGMESTGITLLRSKSVIARAIGGTLLEGTTGAAGRRRTAAMAQHVRERVYNWYMRGYADLYHMYRKESGTGLLTEAWNGKKWKEFEREVFLEIERRGDDTGYVPHPNRLVREAADKVERGFDAMRVEQQHVGTVGNARLGEHSRGYIPHRLSGPKLLALEGNHETMRRLRAILSEQFQDEANGFDKEFSDRLAARYLEQGLDRAKGGYAVPINLHTTEAADIVADALKAMEIPANEIDRLLGKFSRGGAGHTKKRLRLDLNADIGDGMKLADLYDTGVSDLYRGYARRVSGEVALAQFGIMGKKGLMLARKGIAATGGSAEDLRAFDQVAAEFLNTPFGEHNHKYMDNVRIATSLARLGGMGFTQLSEYGNGIHALGIQRVLSTMGDMPRIFKEVRALSKGRGEPNPILKSLDQLGGPVGMDEFANTRLFDVPDNDIQIYGTEAVGLGTRLLRAGGNLQATLSGHRMILGVQVRGMSEQIVRKAIHYVRTGAEDKALDDMGINATLRGRLQENLDRIAKFKGDKLQELDLMAGDLTGHEIMSIRDAVERGAGQIIQRTYIGETGKWAHDGFLKMLTQFRTFGITSIEKQWGRQRATHGALKATAYTIGAMSFALPIYMARVQTKLLGMDEDEAEEYKAKYLSPFALARATMNYASSTGLLSDAMDVGVGAYSSLAGDTMPEQIGARGQQRGGFIGDQIAPGIGLVNDLWGGAMNLRNKDGSWNQGSLRKLERAIPFSSLPYVQPALTALHPDDDD